MKIRNKTILTAFCVVAFSAGADQTALSDAEGKLKATFKNLQFTSFNKGPIDGLFEINTGGSVIYYHPEKELLLMGEFYTKSGVNLTANAVKSASAKLIDRIPLDSALIIGPDSAEKTLIEFTDPDCGFCKSYDRFVGNKPDKIKRIVFFDTRGAEESKKKVIHILCSESPVLAMRDIYNGIYPSSYLSCERGMQQQKAHADAVRVAGTRGTPSFILDGKLTLGFSPAVKDFINDI